jgi:predicted nicotinamide N-methyase
VPARRPSLCDRFGVAIELVSRDVEVAGRRLSLLVPRSADDLLDDVMASGAQEAPYWADLWPSARALAAHLLERGDLAGRRVLELGCGVGLPTVAALLADADVLASDYEPAAVRLTARNARRCARRRPQTMVVDVLDPPEALFAEVPFDLVVAADVLYNRPLVDGLAELLPRLVARNGEVVIAYPFAGQATVLLDALTPLGWTAEESSALVPGWHGATSTVTLLRLRPSG